jgi:hypothetical protein
MKEDFLHQIWKQQLFLKTNPLITGHGEMAVIKTGFKNRHAGPDFEQARIRLADIEWNGSVEIHVRASEWNEHGHQQDAAYQSVILHVVWEKDTDVFRKDGTVVPCLEIKNLVPLEVLFRYRELTEAGKDEMIPCAALLHGTEPFLMVQMQERVLVERLEKKAEAIRRRYLQSGKDWLTTLYHTLAWGIGLKINAEGMEMLAASVPLKTAASTGWVPESRFRKNYIQNICIRQQNSVFSLLRYSGSGFASDRVPFLSRGFSFWPSWSRSCQFSSSTPTSMFRLRPG